MHSHETYTERALPKGPNRVGVSPLTSGRKDIPFPKVCVFYLFGMPDDGYEV
jgi:hypothetical protein